MLGIVQGRLSYAGRKLQSFPKNPFKEFKLASKIGYDFIEFFGERVKNNKNPIWSNSGIKKYIKYSKKNNVKIFSFVDDYVINYSLGSIKTLKVITNTLNRLHKLKIKKYILPLYGVSNLHSKNKRKIYNNLKKISIICSKLNIELLIESNITPIEFRKLKENINLNNLFFLFDTGNRILLERILADDIYKFGKDLKHIHLKDKNIHNKNVIIGKGIVNFKSIFIALKKIKYKESFTVESQRGKDIVSQAKKNFFFFKKLINQYLLK